VGPYAGLTLRNAGDWTDVDWIGFRFYNAAAVITQMNIDGLHFSGYVARVARQVGAYNANDPCLMKVVTDDYAKDDIVADGNKTGAISKMAAAEYYRAVSSPVVGGFTTGMVKDLWPGQKIHCHAHKQAAGTFRVDSDFRVTSFDHILGVDGFTTTWYVTSDVANAHTRPAYASVNAYLASIRPETQNMQAASMKMREIDITQPLLVNTY